MNMLYDLIGVMGHMIPELCSQAAFLKDNPNKDKLMTILQVLGPIVEELKPMIEAEWPEHKDIIEWVDEQYKAWTAH